MMLVLDDSGPGGRRSREQEILDFCQRMWGFKTFEKLSNKLFEEGGEIAGAVVKIPEGRATSHDLDDELGDALIVLAQFAAMRGTTLEDLQERRFNHIQVRAEQKSAGKA